jgi:diguanylate cyclase (GGDEF)-like protein/PAS domain S-box-containing protein
MDRGAELRFKALVHNSRDVFLTLSAALTINWISPAVEALLGFEPDHLVGMPLAALVAPGSATVLDEFVASRSSALVQETVELELHTDTRRTRIVEATLSDAYPGAAETTGDAFVMTWTDLTERRQLEQSLRKPSLYDSLTGLANRGTFHFELQQRLQRLQRSECAGVLHLDLNDFRAVNESIGYERGDELLVAVTDRLSAALRGADLLSRFGGNEFAIATTQDSPRLVVDMANRVAGLFDEPFEIGDRQLRISIALGLTLADSRRAAARNLLEQAALALGAAKGNPQDRIRVYESVMRVTATERFELGGDLVGACDRGELHLVYQPIVEVPSQVTHGVEALVRWVHPLRGPVPPSSFIPLAETSGEIVPLGRWVMAEACRQLVSWRRSRPEAANLGISVNVSARQLELSGETEHLIEIVTNSGLEPEAVTIEITESIVFDDPAWMSQQLAALSQTGMKVAIDDFGTVAAGLKRLREVQFDTVKIDKSYVDPIINSDEDRAVVRSMIDLAHTLGACTVAEGVEEAQQLQILVALGCDLVQGYHLGRPMEPDQLAAWLAERSKAPAAQA